jgi:hypothetical protein
MKKACLGLAALVSAWLCWVSPAAAAEYYWIRLNVSQIPKIFSGGGGGGMMGGPGPGMMGGVGFMGGPGPGPGAMGGVGFMGGPGAMGGFMGGPGAMGGVGFMGGPGPGPGAMGGFMGGPGAMGGVGYMGGPGAMGGVGVMGGDPGGGAKLPTYDPNDVWVNVCLELKGTPREVLKGYSVLSVKDVEQRWGYTRTVAFPMFRPFFQPVSTKTENKFLIMPGGTPIGEVVSVPLPAKWETPAQEFARRIKKEKGSLGIASFALSHGLLREFHQAMEEVGKSKSPGPVYSAYAKLKAELKKAVRSEDPVLRDFLTQLKEDNYRKYDEDSNHYAIYTKQPPGSVDSLLRRRLARLEETYETFFYWLVLNRAPLADLTLPKHQLVAVVIDDPHAYDADYVSWGQPPRHWDGFTAPRDNVVILPLKRVDHGFKELDKELNKLKVYGELSREEILTAELWKNPKAKAQAPLYALVQMLAQIHRTLEEDGERATLTHEGVRQLLVASGLLPRGVKAPEWFVSGIASFFETPPGSPYVHIGAPHWTHAVGFKYYRTSRKLDEEDKKRDPRALKTQVLVEVATDRIFRKAARLKEASKDAKDADLHAIKVKEESDFAQAASWALTYYLVKRDKVPQLLAYRKELSKLPRDLDLDEKFLKNLFVQSFGHVDKKGNLDHRAVEDMAVDWFNLMSSAPVEVGFLEYEGLRQREVAATPPKKTPEGGGTTTPYPYPPGMGPPVGPPGTFPPMGPTVTPPIYSPPKM